jgi:succinoglycan biosynthesis protein ExoM
MKVSVCICTYLRHALLQRVLESLKQADLAGIAADTEVEILVVDNHPGGETAALCERVAAALPVPISCVGEPQRGISQTRNRAVREALSAGADFIAFVDDDDLPRENWLRELLLCQRESAADLVFGSWELDPEVPEWAGKSDIFKSQTHGEPEQKKRSYGLPWMASTCNVLIGRNILEIVGRDGAVFDTGLSHSGGEDKDFFIRALAVGATIASANRSIVTRHHEPGRYSASGLLKRGFKNGCSRMTSIRSHGGLWQSISRTIFSSLKFFVVLLSLPFCAFSKGLFMHQIYRLGKAAGAVYNFFTGKSYTYYSGNG